MASHSGSRSSIGASSPEADLLLRLPGAFHGFDVVTEGAPVVQAFCRARLEALRRGLGLAVSAKVHAT